MPPKELSIPVLLIVLVSALTAGGSPQAARAADPATDAPTARAVGTITLTSQGTSWVPEVRSKFSRWRPVGWGVQAKVKAAGVGDQWVHIEVPTAPFVNGYVTGVYSVQFCAQSSNGAQTRPIRVDLWDGTTRFRSEPVTWWADNAAHCWVIEISPAHWMATVGVSVLLHFANTADQITLQSAAAGFTYG